MARVVVLGGGESGCGSAVLAKVKGFDVFLSDYGQIGDNYIKLLNEYDIEYEQGGHDVDRILSADQIIKSPGISDKTPIVKAIKQKGIPIISEIEFAARYSSAKKICITGSNGKTTTTTLVYNILRDAGYNVALGGNIGESYALSVATGNYDYYVLELSSFQLDGCFDFRADVAVLMNITPDHLDRYDYCLQNYVDSKFRIVRNQSQSDVFIYCGDDPLTMANIDRHNILSAHLPFSVKSECENGATGGFAGGDMIRVFCADKSLTMFVDDLKIGGIHNRYNVMAASMAAMSVGVDTESIMRTLSSFEGVEHRIERAGEVDGVLFINDSKGTNVDSVWYALESMTRPVVWIAGGTDKGNDYSALYELIEGRVKALVCMGVDNEKLKGAFAGRIEHIEDTHSLDDAMKAAVSLAECGDVVLLSPACASFDLFKNYEHRGELFKQWVAEYAKK